VSGAQGIDCILLHLCIIISILYYYIYITVTLYIQGSAALVGGIVYFNVIDIYIYIVI
jgi:hypothetical protein